MTDPHRHLTGDQWTPHWDDPKWAVFSPQSDDPPMSAVAREALTETGPAAFTHLARNTARSFGRTFSAAPGRVRAATALTAAAGALGAATGQIDVGTGMILATYVAPAIPYANVGMERLVGNKERTGGYFGAPSSVPLRKRLNPVRGFLGLMQPPTGYPDEE